MRRVAALVVVFLAVGCAKRPDALKRDARLDSECHDGTVAFVYPISDPADKQAAQSGCHAPIGAWTDESDVRAGGVRKMVHDLRDNEKRTLLCCRE